VSSALPAAAPDPAPKRRTLLGHLLIPRPKDLVKALLMPMTFGAATGPDLAMSTREIDAGKPSITSLEGVGAGSRRALSAIPVVNTWQSA
jgi:hypothetical protein